MLSRTEKTIIGLIEQKHSQWTRGELEAMILREELSDIVITFKAQKNDNGNLAGNFIATYDVGIKKKKSK
tara:strand:+ start:1083 stop:1292 length:210 start_codon:yes stop_codon:yes gene_type:complete